MNYKEYMDNHFGEPIDIYTKEDKVVYSEIVPRGTPKVYTPSEEEGEVFSFVIDDQGISLEIPLTCILKLSAENTVTPADRT